MSQESYHPQPRLQIDTSSLQEPLKYLEPATPTPTGEKYSFDTEKNPYLQPEPQLGEVPYTPATEARHDTRNKSHEGLLRLIGSFLDELRRRPAPPSVFDGWIYDRPVKSNRNTKVLVTSLKGVAAFQHAAGKREMNQKFLAVPDDSDEDEEKEKQGFSTDITAAILTRLRASLIEVEGSGWQLDARVSGSELGSASGKMGSPFRSRRRSLRPIGRRSRSPSPAVGVNIRTQDILGDCLTLLASIISEDCRFQTPIPGPARPPNALQSITLDIALILCKMYRYDPQVLSRIGMALMPAFAAFKADMHSRLLSIFNDWILRDMLDDLRRVQGGDSSFSEDATDMNHDIPSRAPSISIQVQEVQDDQEQSQRSTWVPWTKPGQSARGVPSTNSPAQSLQIYFLSSLVQPLVSAIGENVVDTAPTSTLFSLYRVISTLTGLKRDVYLDILTVVAYSPPRARHFALSLLATLSPRAIGHISVSKAFPPMTYWDSLERSEGRSIQGRSQPQHHSYSHQFTAWNFITPSSVPDELNAGFKCRVCSGLLRGFGLLCSFCMCAVHFDCYDYPEGSHLSEYTLSDSSNRQKVAVYRFCHLLANKDEDTAVRARSHTFRPVNIFTICLCLVCRKPLWGCSMQGYRCVHCNLFAHLSCLSAGTNLLPCRAIDVDASYIGISWNELRDSFCEYYQGILTLASKSSRMTYEELSILHAVLWMQLQILNNGLILGSIVVNRSGLAIIANMKENGLEEFEIHSSMRLLESLLSSSILPPSSLLQEYLLCNRLVLSEHSFFYDWSTLTYVSSIIIASDETLSGSHVSLGLLNVAEPESTDNFKTSYQAISMGRMRDALARGFGVYSDDAARLFLHHIHQLGFFERVDRSDTLFNDFADPSIVECSFPLPFGLDESADVEHLVAAVEVCLRDLDLSVNEAGFLLLVRRLWPNEMTSDYARIRLCSSIVTWILMEDESLAKILRDYVAQGRALPGVRSRLEVQSWPSPQDLRHTPSTSTNNGGDYIACRRALLHQYATRWLLGLHNLDMDAYAGMVYDICAEFARKDTPGTVLALAHDSNDLSVDLSRHDDCLRFLIKLCQASVAFTAVDDLIQLWLQYLPADCQPTKPLQTTLRLFNREGDGAHRYSSVADGMAGTVLASLDPWRIVLSAARQKEQFVRSLHWLSFLSASGVEVPVNTYLNFAALTSEYESSLEDAEVLVKAAMGTTWLRSLGHQRLQGVIAGLHSRHASEVIECMRSGINMPTVISFIRHSLSICLLLFGCERQALISCGFVRNEEIQYLPFRRKLNARAAAVDDPIIVDGSLITSLRDYVGCAVEEVSTIVAKFFNMLVKEAMLLEPHEVDNLILKNEDALCACAWQFYDLPTHDIANIRTGLLLRILVVDTHPFRVLLHNIFEKSSSWELRFQAITRLFRVILDVTSPAFNVGDRQFRSSCIDVFYYYFRSLWADEKEEIRLTIDTWSKSLLPAHFEAIAACWNEALPKIPIGQRVELLSFLVQLRPHFPEWQVLSWEVIVEMILEDDYLQKNGNNEDGPAAAHLSMYGLSSRDSTASSIDSDPDVAALRVSIILLSLQMIATGVSIDVITLLRVKMQLLRTLGFSDISSVNALSGNAFYIKFGSLTEVPELALPCIAELPALFDAFHPFDLAPSIIGGPPFQEETSTTLLVGSIFIDVLLALINKQDLRDMPANAAKRLMEALLIVIYKHDFESKPLRHFMPDLRTAVRHTMDILLSDVAYELRQLGLSVCSAYIKCWGGTSSAIISESVETAAKAIELLHYNGEDALVAQLRSFIETTLALRVWSGIFTAICRKHLESQFFVVIDQMDKNIKSSQIELPLREALLRDTLARAAADNNRDSRHLQQVINNLNRYVEMVYHKDCNAELLSFVGQQLAAITKRMAEAPESFDPSPLLLLSATLVEHNKARSHELLRFLDIVLRSCLIRFNISCESLMRLARVSMNIYGRPQPPLAGQRMGEGHYNVIIGTMLDCLSDGLRGKARVTSSTLTGMLEVVSSTDAFDGRSGSSVFADFVVNLAEDGLCYLSATTTSAVYSDADFACARAVSRFILRTTDDNAGPFLKQVERASGRPPLTVRAWNALLVTALSIELRSSTRLLLEHFSTFMLVYHRCLKVYSVADPGAPGLTGADINYAYISIKLWLLLARKVYLVNDETGGTAAMSSNEDNVSRRLWNDLWPPFEQLLVALEEDARGGSIEATSALILSSIADLFMFLHQSRSVVALDLAVHAEVLNRARALTRNETMGNKISRVLRTMSEPAGDVPWQVLVNQITLDMIATEKLHVLETSRKDTGRNPYEKGRREGRVT